MTENPSAFILRKENYLLLIPTVDLIRIFRIFHSKSQHITKQTQTTTLYRQIDRCDTSMLC